MSRGLISRANRGRRVVDRVAGELRWEIGGPLAVDGEHVAVVAHYAAESRTSPSLRALVRELSAAGYRTLVVSAGGDPGRRLEWGDDRPDAVLRKPNLGYDFGSWAVGLQAVPGVRRARRVLLVNDSMLGPFAQLKDICAEFEQNRADVWALTDTRQYFHHLQSYFLGFRDGVLADRPLSDFYANVRQEPTKWDVIRRYELGLSVLLKREGYAVTAARPGDELAAPGENPVIKGWWRLLDRSVPLVKREILREPAVAPYGDRLPAEIRDRYREDVYAWM
jgi:hypothetical protein